MCSSHAPTGSSLPPSSLHCYPWFWWLYGAVPPTGCLAIFLVLGDPPKGAEESIIDPLFVYGFLVALALYVFVRVVHHGGGVNLTVSGIMVALLLLGSAQVGGGGRHPPSL